MFFFFNYLSPIDTVLKDVEVIVDLVKLSI